MPTLIKELKTLSEKEKDVLIKNKIVTFEQLLYYFPFRYEEAPSAKQIKDISLGENVSISGIVVDIDPKTSFQSGKKYTKIIVSDNTDSLEVIWWNMPYLAKTLYIDQKIILTGTVAEKNSSLYLNNPKIEKVKSLPINADKTLFQKDDSKPLTPIYTNFRNEKKINISKIIHNCLKSVEFKKVENIIPKKVSEKLNLGSRQNAILRKHLPLNEEDKIYTNKYFAFEEIFLMQVYREQEKILRSDSHSYKIKVDTNFRTALESILPFQLTNGQKEVLETIFEDIQKNKPMSRLVEGDVGSGKTILALAASLATVMTEVKNAKHLQVAYIAPTEILASQHYDFFTKTLSKFTNINIALLTASGAKIFPSKINKEVSTNAPKSRVKKLLDDGRLNIVIGTHSLFNKNILFEHLGLVIIDEQHRFGVKQRLAMIEKHKSTQNNKKQKRPKNDLREIAPEYEDLRMLPIPHLLSMSATPIPRTLALTIYGDLDLSILDELPPGRKRAETRIITKFDREKMYSEVRKKLELGKQVYIIAPRIKDSEDSEDKQKSSVEFEAKRISEKFPNWKIGILHGKQSKQQKEKIIEEFYNKKVDILISTTVVEVGISVPNATCIVIENSDTFGLAQLHQLRGRVERSTEHSICFLVTETDNQKSLRRLEALVKSSNGFELAEVDLSERGAGSLIGNRQSGLTDIGMEAIKNRKLVEIAKESAYNLLQEDPTLKNKDNLLLKSKIEEITFHEE